MRNLFNLLNGDKTFDLIEKVSKPAKWRYSMKEHIQTITTQDVEFLQELLDALGEGGYGKIGRIVRKYFPNEITSEGGGRVYTIISTKALAFILALREGRKPTDE